jgi:hypothetical protein
VCGPFPTVGHCGSVSGEEAEESSEGGEPPVKFGLYSWRRNWLAASTVAERYRQGETMSTAFVESTINQVVSRRFVKKQQMH